MRIGDGDKVSIGFSGNILEQSPNMIVVQPDDRNPSLGSRRGYGLPRTRRTRRAGKKEHEHDYKRRQQTRRRGQFHFMIPSKTERVILLPASGTLKSLAQMVT